MLARRFGAGGQASELKSATIYQSACQLRKTCAAAWIDRPFSVRGFIALVAAAAFALVLSVTFSARAELGWLTDYKTAQEQAKSGNKLLLLDFTGSDWCGYCIQLDRAILSQPQFKDYASKNLVLLEVDFPRRKPQSVETKRQNQELAQRYQIEGFPTLVVLNGAGQTIWRYDGFYTGGVDAFLAQLNKLHKG